MNTIMIGLIVFGCVFGGALLGMVARSVLPDHHLSDESNAAVMLGIGVIGTMTALVLGLLIASARTSFDNQSNAKKIILLERILAHYGPQSSGRSTKPGWQIAPTPLRQSGG